MNVNLFFSPSCQSIPFLFFPVFFSRFIRIFLSPSTLSLPLSTILECFFHPFTPFFLLFANPNPNPDYLTLEYEEERREKKREEKGKREEEEGL